MKKNNFKDWFYGKTNKKAGKVEYFYRNPIIKLINKGGKTGTFVME